MAHNIEEMVREFHSTDPLHVSYSEDNDRLWVHDFLHAWLRTPAVNAKGEEVTAIYQSVLLRHDGVSPRRGMHADGGKDITLQTIHEKIIPGVREFAARLGRRHGFKTKAALNDEEIKEHFEKAKILGGIVVAAKGKYFGEWSLDEIKATPVGEFRRYLTQMEETYNAQHTDISKHR